MSFMGMDTEQARNQADTLDSAANRLGELLEELNSTAMSVEWHGADADRFREEWNQVRSLGDDTVLPDMRSRSQDLVKHAEEQDHASDSDGTGGGLLDALRDFFGGIADGIRDIVDGVRDFFGGVVDGIKDGVEWIGDRIGEAVDGIKDYFGTLGGNLAEMWRSGSALVGMAADAIFKGEWPRLSEAVVGGLDFIADTLNTAHHAITGEDRHFGDDGQGYADAPQLRTGDHGLQDPTSVADIIHNTNAAYNDHGTVNLTVVRDAEGNPTGVIANIPGTQDWSPFAGDNPLDLSGNAAQAGPNNWSAGSEATADAIAQLYRENGIPADTPLMLSGHSQGGMVAASLAGNPEFASQYNVTNVMTYGSPVDGHPVNPGADYLNVQHQTDIVPRIDAEGFPGRSVSNHPNVDTVTLDNPGPWWNAKTNHGSAEYHTSVDNQLRDPNSQISQYQNSNSMDPFLVDQGGSADHYSSDLHREN